MDNSGPNPIQLVLNDARAALERGDINRASESLDLVLGAVADTLDPTRAGQGPRLIPPPLKDGIMDLPLVVLNETTDKEDNQ